jgi:hypothetical protein
VDAQRTRSTSDPGQPTRDLRGPWRRMHGIDLSASPSGPAGQAIFTGCTALLTVARQTVLQMLPRSVAFAQNNSVSDPCLLVFGEQSNGTTFFGGFPAPWGIRYHELMVAVPFVRCETWPGDHLFVSGMTCDFWPAVWAGNVYYGYRKRHAQMTWDSQRFCVTGEGQHHSFDAIVRRRSTLSEEHFARIQSAAALPVLGSFQDGVLVRSRFEWDLREATIEDAALTLTLSPDFRELPLGNHTHDSHAFFVRQMRWRVSWPKRALSA